MSFWFYDFLKWCVCVWGTVFSKIFRAGFRVQGLGFLGFRV